MKDNNNNTSSNNNKKKKDKTYGFTIGSHGLHLRLKHHNQLLRFLQLGNILPPAH